MLNPDTLCHNTQCQNLIRHTPNISSNCNLHLTMPLLALSCSSGQARRIQHMRNSMQISSWQDWHFFFFFEDFFLGHFCTSTHFGHALWLVAALFMIGCCFKLNSNYAKWYNWYNNFRWDSEVGSDKRTVQYDFIAWLLFFSTKLQGTVWKAGGWQHYIYLSVICVS